MMDFRYSRDYMGRHEHFDCSFDDTSNELLAYGPIAYQPTPSGGGPVPIKKYLASSFTEAFRIILDTYEGGHFHEGYKGYKISPKPVSGDGQWHLDCQIEKLDNGNLYVTSISTANSFSNKEEAVFHSFLMAEKQIEEGLDF